MAPRWCNVFRAAGFDKEITIMWQPASKVAAVFAPFIVAAASVAAGAELPAVTAADQNLGVDGLSAEAARMYGFVKTPHPDELKWQQIPWLTDLNKAIQQATTERRPLLLFVSGDDPLEKC